MAPLRTVRLEDDRTDIPCDRCGAHPGTWDRVAGRPWCPECQESLAQAEADAVRLRTERQACSICGKIGTVRFVTFPLGSRRGVAMDLCGKHFRALLGRRLDVFSFFQLSRQLAPLSLSTRHIFLLHEAFYDGHGHALQPALDLDP